MKIEELQSLYAQSPQVGELAGMLRKKSVRSVFLEGLVASSAAMNFAALHAAITSAASGKGTMPPFLFILQDGDEAGYFYHDLTQMLGDRNVLFFPSSYRRAVKYGQRDAANEILRTEVLARTPLSAEHSSLRSPLYIVSYPEAVAELVISRQRLDCRTLVLQQGQAVPVDAVTDTLRQFGFSEVDYVYEPGQFALRGSILDVFSYSSEYPFRVDFFGDDIDSIRTFEVENQLSRDKREQIEIVPELGQETENRVSLLSFLPRETVLVMKDLLYVRETIDRTYEEGFSSQAIQERLRDATEMEQQQLLAAMRKEVQLTTGAQFAREAGDFRLVEMGHRPTRQPDATISFHTSAQPLFHKNFDLLQHTFDDYRSRGYHLYILADSQKLERNLGRRLHPR